MFEGQLLIGSLMVVSTVAFHISSLVLLARTLKRLAMKVSTLLVTAAVLVIIGIHTVEAWSWAVLYYVLGEFAEFEQSLYFSSVTVTTLGYGDVTLSERWRLLSTFEAMGGLLLFGASTAFLLGLMQHLFADIDK